VLHNLRLYKFARNTMNASPMLTYGADSSGLICGFLFGASGHGVAITAEDADDL
jgi:hypothetical protein